MKQFKIMAWTFTTSKDGWTTRIDYPTEFVNASCRFTAYDQFCKSKGQGDLHCTMIEGDGVLVYNAFYEVIPGKIHNTWKGKRYKTNKKSEFHINYHETI